MTKRNTPMLMLASFAAGASAMWFMHLGAGQISAEVAEDESMPAEMLALALPLSGGTHNIKLASDSEEMLPSGPLPDNFPVLTLHENIELAAITTSAIKSACITPMGSSAHPAWEQGFHLQINLTSEGREKFAAPLLGEKSKAVSIKLLGITAQDFKSDPAKAKAFAANTGSSEVAGDFVGADVEYYFTPDSSFAGLGLATYLSGSSKITACDPAVDLTKMPGYSYYTALTAQFGW